MNKVLSFLFVVFATVSFSQTVGDFKPNSDKYGLKKVDADRVFIAEFVVNYQIYNEKQDFKQGGNMFGGGKRGDALAEASIGIDGITAESLQSMTNDLYNDFVSDLQASDLEIVSADEASNTETYEGFIRVDDGEISEAEIEGTLSVYPENYSFFIKGEKKDGKKKKGGFLGDANFLSPALSRDLDNAIIARVNLTVLFVEDKNTFKGNGAKIKVKTNLRLAANDAVVMKKSDDKKIKFKGENSVSYVNSSVSFVWGKIKVGAGAESSYTGTMKSALEVEGVVEDTKVTSYASGSVDSRGVSTIYGTWYSVRDEFVDNTKIIEVEDAAYKEGVSSAMKTFLSHHTSEYLSAID